MFHHSVSFTILRNNNFEQNSQETYRNIIDNCPPDIAFCHPLQVSASGKDTAKVGETTRQNLEPAFLPSKAKASYTYNKDPAAYPQGMVQKRLEGRLA